MRYSSGRRTANSIKLGCFLGDGSRSEVGLKGGNPAVAFFEENHQYSIILGEKSEFTSVSFTQRRGKDG